LEKGDPLVTKGSFLNLYFIKKRFNVDTLWSLVEKTEAHVIIRLLLLLFLLLLNSLFGGTGSSTTSSGGTTRDSTTAGDGSKLGSAFLNQLKIWEVMSVVELANVILACLTSYLVDVLAFNGREEGSDTGVLSLDTNGGENSLDLIARGSGIATGSQQKVSSEVFHFRLFCSNRRKIIHQSNLFIHPFIHPYCIWLMEVILPWTQISLSKDCRSVLLDVEGRRYGGQW
jgi:hypothetical protein